MSNGSTLPPLRQAILGEVAGTYLLVLFGTGAVASAVLTGALIGLGQVALVWGFGVTIAICSSAALSGAHLNPAVSLSFSLLRRDEFPARRLGPYVVAQLAGAILAGATVALVYGPFIARYEQSKGITRGAPGSELSAMIFGQYFPNPAIYGVGEAARALVSPLHAVLVEGFGTAILVFVIFALTAKVNAGTPLARAAPLVIGFTVAALLPLFAPITQAGWNPARDFGPRLVALALGWGSLALPGPGGGFWVYIVGPFIGGPLGGIVWQAIGRGSRLEGARSVPVYAQLRSKPNGRKLAAGPGRRPFRSPQRRNRGYAGPPTCDPGDGRGRDRHLQSHQ